MEPVSKLAEKFLKKKKYYTPEEIDYENAGKFTPNADEGFFRENVAFALSKIPIKTVNKIMKKSIILSGKSKGSGEYFPAKLVRKLFKRKDLIILNQESINFEYAILHECAHCYLNHTHGYIAENWTEEIRLRQEKEADDLVKKWLQEYEEADPITKISEEDLVRLAYKQQGVDI